MAAAAMLGAVALGGTGSFEAVDDPPGPCCDHWTGSGACQEAWPCAGGWPRSGVPRDDSIGVVVKVG